MEKVWFVKIVKWFIPLRAASPFWREDLLRKSHFAGSAGKTLKPSKSFGLPFGALNIFKKFLAKGSDITAPTYESLRAPLFSIIMLGINPFAWKRRIIQIPSQRINVRTGETVLDVATGTGLVARELSEMVGLQGHVCGLDISLGMLKMARKKANQAGLTNITYIKGDSEELPFKDGVFHGVTCFNTIVTEQVIAEISRVLRKGYKFVTTVGGKTRKMSPLLKIILKSGRKYRLPIFSESEITELLEKYDFKDIHCLEWIGPILPVEAEKR